MTEFSMIPVSVQNSFCFAALLLCFITVAESIMSVRQRQLRSFAASACLFSAAYFLMQVIVDLSVQRAGKTGSGLASAAGALPWAAFAAALAALTLLSLRLLTGLIRWSESHIGPQSVRESMDELPAGICYYTDRGFCLLMNHRMNDICLALTGTSLQNGISFYDSVKGSPVCRLPDGSAVSFRHRTLDFSGTEINELIADEVTELYDMQKELQARVERSRRLQEGLKEYSRTIDDTVREAEILQARISIHDGINQMLLATKRVLSSGDEDERRRVIKMWEDQALLLSGEVKMDPGRDVIADLGSLASVIGIELEWRGVPDTDDPSALTLFLLAAREAMANASKHAGAKKLIIDVSQNNICLTASFRNDGASPSSTIDEKGGLRNLRRRIEEAGGMMTVKPSPDFMLSVEIPIGGKRYGI